MMDDNHDNQQVVVAVDEDGVVGVVAK